MCLILLPGFIFEHELNQMFIYLLYDTLVLFMVDLYPLACKLHKRKDFCLAVP